MEHQTIGMHLEPGFLEGLRQRLEEILPINIIPGDLFPAISAADQACPAVAWSEGG